jgi:hypothetical protein
MKTTEINKKDYPNRIKALLEYLNQGLYGQEDAIKQLLLFTLAKQPIALNGNLKGFVYRHVSAAFIEFYNDENFSIPCFEEGVQEFNMSRTPDENFFDFITSDIPKLVPTEEQKSLLFSMEEVDEMQKEIKKIRLSDGVKRLISYNRDYFVDTRWQKIVHVLQMSAFLNRRDVVCLSDLFDYRVENSNIYYNFYDFIELIRRGNHNRKEDPSLLYEDQPPTWIGYEDSDRFYFLSEEEYERQDSEIAFVMHCRLRFKEIKKEPSAVKQLKKSLEEKYSILTDRYDTLVAACNSFKAELLIENIFACKDVINEIDKAIDKHIENFEYVKTEMKKIYDKIEFSFVKDINIGDRICADGSVNKKNDRHVATICIKGSTADSLYGIGDSLEEKTFEEAEKIAESYTCNGSPVYSKDWSIPTIEQLEQIYNNRELPNAVQLTGKYWSSTKKDNDAVYFFDFDKGKKDYTTPDHKYKLALIHRFGE